jgi:hypothetical protein
MEFFWFWGIVGVICAIVAYFKNRNIIIWSILGILFSIVTFTVLIFLPKIDDLTDTFPCPYCKSPVKNGVNRCEQCDSDL